MFNSKKLVSSQDNESFTMNYSESGRRYIWEDAGTPKQSRSSPEELLQGPNQSKAAGDMPKM